MELLIGAGANRTKKISPPGQTEWKDLVTLDMNPDHKPDVVHDLTVLPYPFEPNKFDEIHAYEVLEHTGQQGDFRFFLDQFAELWRILKPYGVLVGTSPYRTSPWAWGDPGHTRIISEECFTFLNQLEYINQVGTTTMSDYRRYYSGDFNKLHTEVNDDTFVFVLQAIKPARSKSDAIEKGFLKQDDQQQYKGVPHRQNV